MQLKMFSSNLADQFILFPTKRRLPMIHIVFQHADVDVLKKAIELDESLEGEILEIREEFAVGPLHEIDTEEGWNARVNWWNTLVSTTPYSRDTFDFDD